MKAIILAGGKGTRLYPITLGVSKQLLPVNDVPMIYYPLSVLLRAGISEIAIISTPDHLPGFENLLGSGSQLGAQFTYIEQPQPEGIAQAFILAKKFIGRDACALILGDNIFYGSQLTELLKSAIYRAADKATLFVYEVKDSKRYGVIEKDASGKILSIEEKPKHPKSNLAVTGLYVYPNSIVSIANSIRPSARGELEITDVNVYYMKSDQLLCEQLGRGYAWFDTGTINSLYQATDYVRALEDRQGFKIGCIEEAAFQAGLLSKAGLQKRAAFFEHNDYGTYLKSLIQ
ncbi:MAG: glucose-1-phosphate thymidylyltransferase RfbA [Flavobacteriaceae bacterium]